MFCPNCRYEYRDGFTECATCRVLIVDTLPPEPERESVDVIEILRTYNAADIAMITCAFDAEGITNFMQGEHFHNFRPLAQPVIVLVRKDQAERAGAILDRIEPAWSAINISEMQE